MSTRTRMDANYPIGYIEELAKSLSVHNLSNEAMVKILLTMEYDRCERIMLSIEDKLGQVPFSFIKVIRSGSTNMQQFLFNQRETINRFLNRSPGHTRLKARQAYGNLSHYISALRVSIDVDATRVYSKYMLAIMEAGKSLRGGNITGTREWIKTAGARMNTWAVDRNPMGRWKVREACNDMKERLASIDLTPRVVTKESYNPRTGQIVIKTVSTDYPEGSQDFNLLMRDVLNAILVEPRLRAVGVVTTYTPEMEKIREGKEAIYKAARRRRGMV